MDALEEIKRLYYNATKATIARDIDRAIDLLKTLPSDDERERVAVYMDGLAQMRSEWAQASGGGVSPSRSRAYRPTGSSRSASAPPNGAPRGRSGRSPASSRRHR
jgi:hypothetical protein